MKNITPSLDAQVQRIATREIRRTHRMALQECARLYSCVQAMTDRGMDTSSVLDVARSIREDLMDEESDFAMVSSTYHAVRALADDVERALEVGHE